MRPILFEFEPVYGCLIVRYFDLFDQSSVSAYINIIKSLNIQRIALYPPDGFSSNNNPPLPLPTMEQFSRMQPFIACLNNINYLEIHDCPSLLLPARNLKELRLVGPSSIPTLNNANMSGMVLNMLCQYNLQSLNIEGVDLDHHLLFKMVLSNLHRVQPQINMNFSIDPNHLPISLNLTSQEIESILMQNGSVQGFWLNYTDNITSLAQKFNITSHLYGFKLIDECLNTLYSIFNMQNFYPIFLTKTAISLRENTYFTSQDPEQETSLNSLLAQKQLPVFALWLKNLIPQLGVKKTNNQTEAIFLSTFKELDLKSRDPGMQAIEADTGITQKIIAKITLKLCQYFNLSPTLFEMPPYPHAAPYCSPSASLPTVNSNPVYSS